MAAVEIAISVAGTSAASLLLARVAWQQLNGRLQTLEKDHVSTAWMERACADVEKKLDSKQSQEAFRIEKENFLDRLAAMEARAAEERIENKEDHKTIISALERFGDQLS